MSRPPGAIAIAVGCAERAAGGARRGRRRGGCSRSGRAAARARPWSASRWQHRDGVGVLGRRHRASRRPGAIASASTPASARPERHAPASAPPRTQAWRPPSWSRAPPVASSEKEAMASASRAGHVQAAAVGGDRERGRAEQADARGAATAAAGPHAAGGAAQLRQRTGLDVTRERRHRARDGRDGIEVTAVGRERHLRDAAQCRGHGRSPRPPTTRRSRGHRSSCVSAPVLSVALERGDRRAATGVEVAPVGADRHGPRALEARGARAAGRRRLREAELRRGDAVSSEPGGPAAACALASGTRAASSDPMRRART